MTDLIKYLYSLKTIDGVDLWKSRRKTFILGFATAIKSIFEISKKLLASQHFKFILTHKLNQDAIELFFGPFRGRFGHNDNPICLQFRYALRSISLHISIKQSTGNCSLLTSHEDSFFSLKWKYKKMNKY